MLVEKPYDSEETKSEEEKEATLVPPTNAPRKRQLPVQIGACTRSSTTASPLKKKVAKKVTK